MRKADRLFQLVNLLRARQQLTAQVLAEELALSVRTVYRYIDDLSVSGIPIYGEPGLGYRLDEHFELPPLTLTPDELDVLLLGVQMVATSTGRKLPAASRTLLSKIEAASPAFTTQAKDQWAYALSVQDRSAATERWDALQDAVCFKRVVHLRYQTPGGELSYREVWPLGLFYWGGKWTMASWCMLRKSFRDFRLDRMQKVEVHLSSRLKSTSSPTWSGSPLRGTELWSRLLTQRCQ